ncbi:hypothetical protein [Paraburkholderia megapolitana]|uniref:hypothetical protein n=1 Tax=Paraburkholderia megapolitana TaxID=420953 RepID=UPI000B8A2490|nr:hypothetical protein [Paraburkholderia megapolitana]QDQ82200.1 hypothetical protein FNZ07_12930 [Paraburkholderia megapolitana]
MALAFDPGQTVRLIREAFDDETGYSFPAGSVCEFAQSLGGARCVVEIDKALGDPLDHGWTPVVVDIEILEAI